MNEEEQLKALERDFTRAGYTRESIRNIEESNDAITITDMIDNLEGEMAYWND